VVLLDLGLEFRIATDVILIAGLLGMGIGYFNKGNKNHLFRMFGLIFFGIFWVLQTPYFILIGDLFNAIVCILAMPFYTYLGYHEYLSYENNEEIESLKWIVGASFFAGGLYLLIDKIPILSGYLIYGVTVNTVWLINLFGYSYGVGEINYAENPLWYRTNLNEIRVPIEGSNLVMIQSCTALQSMLIFIAAIYCVQAATKRKWYAFFAIIPVIYVLNLVRNVSVIYMMDQLGWSYELAHHQIGKGGSFLALIALAAIAFKLLPELLDNIWGLADLRKRDQEPKDKTKKEGKDDTREEDKEEGDVNEDDEVEESEKEEKVREDKEEGEITGGDEDVDMGEDEHGVGGDDEEKEVVKEEDKEEGEGQKVEEANAE
jgi:archaeosortase A (PGF-CTERM-specific)